MEKMASHGERVLVVEDEYLIRLALCDGLSLFGFVVSQAKNGDEALDALKEAPVNLVITDVKCPDPSMAFNSLTSFSKTGQASKFWWSLVIPPQINCRQTFPWLASPI